MTDSPTPTPVRVAVFVDWQNVYKTAREAFGLWQQPNEFGNFCPFQLSRVLAFGNGRGANGELVRVNIHRGLPSQKFDQPGYAANRRQAAAWVKAGGTIVQPCLRPLRYPRGYPDRTTEPPREKGIDVQLAVEAVEWSVTGKADVVIIFSHDTDLVPVVELLCRLKGTKSVETASWRSDTFNQRLRHPDVYHHGILKAVFDKVETRVNYGRAAT